jgi:hypothetical protein
LRIAARAARPAYPQSRKTVPRSAKAKVRRRSRPRLEVQTDRLSRPPRRNLYTRR